MAATVSPVFRVWALECYPQIIHIGVTRPFVISLAMLLPYMAY